MKEVDPLEALEKYGRQFRTKQEAAKSLGVTGGFYSDMLKGYRKIPASILEQLGLRRAVVQEKAS